MNGNNSVSSTHFSVSHPKYSASAMYEKEKQIIHSAIFLYRTQHTFLSLV